MCSRGAGRPTVMKWKADFTIADEFPPRLIFNRWPKWSIHSCEVCDPDRKYRLNVRQRFENRYGRQLSRIDILAKQIRGYKISPLK